MFRVFDSFLGFTAGTQPCLVNGGVGVDGEGSNARVGAATQPCQEDGGPQVDVGGSSVRAGAVTQPYQGDGGTGGGSRGRAGAVPNPYRENGGTGVDVRGSTARAGAATQACQEDGGTGGGSRARAGAAAHPCQEDGVKGLDEGVSVDVRAEASMRPNLEEKAALELIRSQSLAVEKATDKVKEGNQGRVGNVFKMREVIEGNMKKVQEPHAIKDLKQENLLYQVRQ